ncbi:hypothetical protein SNEBB_007917 [Seison nebaliae]|nr:hypothetical protein SNEBB_007917 [Seison nebaliae]
MEMISFNTDHGYLEGLLRGFRSGILTTNDYLNLTSCNSLDDLKSVLQAKDYGQFLANESSVLTVALIDERLRDKLVIEFQHIRSQAVSPLSKFLDYITYGYMIDNIILLITGTLHHRSLNELLNKCHPLGSFEQMKAIQVASTSAELYNAIIVDTPLAPYFQDCVSEHDLDELNVEVIRNTLYRAYLEDFHAFCKSLGGSTANVMCELLAFEADRRAFLLTINSFGTELTKDDRSKLYPKCGKLHPEGLAKLANADDYEQVHRIAEMYDDYRKIFDEADTGLTGHSGERSVEDRFFEKELCQIERAGMSEYHLDSGMCGSTTSY